MLTQLQATPVLTGECAEDVLKQLEKKPTARQREQAKAKAEFFARMRRR